MTTIYAPRLIDSAEQAEVLDRKTPIQIVLNRTQEVHDVRLSEDFAEDFWLDALEPGNRWVYVALVPIEAGEEWGLMDADGTTYRAGSREHAQRWQQTIGTPLARRLVTPWEEA